MSDPLKDAAAQKRSKKRESIRETHTPLVLWIKSECSTQEVRDYLFWELDRFPGVSVARQNVPYKYATSGVFREEKADGNVPVDNE